MLHQSSCSVSNMLIDNLYGTILESISEQRQKKGLGLGASTVHRLVVLGKDILLSLSGDMK